MGDLNNCGAFIIEALEQIHNHFALTGMEAAGWLIGENELGITDDGASDSDELLLTAGELVWVESFLADDLETVEDIGDHTVALGFFDVAVGKREIEVFRNGQIIEQMILLKNEANVFLVQLNALAIVEPMDFVIGKLKVALPGAVEHSNDAHERGLACAGWPHNGDEFALTDFEVDPAQDPRFASAGFIKLFDIDHSNHVCLPENPNSYRAQIQKVRKSLRLEIGRVHVFNNLR